jgi:uncharacterized protein YjbI with pentapeptide repeats
MDDLVLPDLTDGVAEDLVSRADLVGTRYAGLDISGRDLTGARFEECELSSVRLEETKLTAVRLIDCRLENLDVAVLLAARPTWRGVELRSSRLGSAELYDGEWDSVRVTDCRLGYLNFRHGKLTEVRFVGCRVTELDLSGASLSGVSFVDCEIDTLTVTGARLKDVDLRGVRLHEIAGLSALSGATIDQLQLAQLGPLLAAEAGITVV